MLNKLWVAGIVTFILGTVKQFWIPDLVYDDTVVNFFVQIIIAIIPAVGGLAAAYVKKESQAKIDKLVTGA